MDPARPGRGGCGALLGGGRYSLDRLAARGGTRSTHRRIVR
ncbi:MAG TPA: hypothetical protein VF613_08500 [Longimicrobium sp.]